MRWFLIIGFLLSAAILYASVISNPGGPPTCGTNPIGIQLKDANGCFYCQTIKTDGTVQVTQISCPSVPDILMENGTFVLAETGGKIALE